MIITIIFILLLSGVLAAWIGYRQIAVSAFGLVLILATVEFLSHITTTLAVQL